MKISIFGSKTLEIALCATLLLFSSCSTLKFHYYDETTDKKLTYLHSDINHFLTSYKKNKNIDYVAPFGNFLDQISSLELRARSRKNNETQVMQLKMFKGSVLDAQGLFPLRDDETIELVRNLMEGGIEPILHGEISKVRK